MIFSPSNPGSNDDYIAILDLGTSKFTCMIARHGKRETGGDLDLTIVGFAVYAAAGFKAGVLTDLDAAEHAVRNAVASAEAMARVKVQELIVGVSCGRLKSLNFSTSVQVGERPVHDLHLGELLRGGRDYAVSDGRALLHLLPAGYTLDGATAIRDPRGMVGGELSLDLHAITADVGPLRNIALLLDRCHLRVARLIASPYASALATVRSDEKDLGTTIIDIGGGTSKLALYAGGHFIYSDTIALGGDLLTYALAQQVSMPLRDAERIKTLHGSLFSAPKDRDSLIGHNVIGGSSMAEDHITKAELTAILREKSFYMLNVIKHRLDKSGFGAYSGQRLVLTGGGAQLSGMCEFASDIFQKPTRLGAPSALPGLPREALAPAFATSLGLYQAFVSYDAVNEKLNQPLKSYTRGTFSRVSKWLKESF